ncbi:septal ring lytic transglycosylase RlpA family protein [Methylobacterium iners]|uniref:Endolytic peptidoglycan transglycosylase RlpA n=1 Tax=Methylobacterium iners TaxID=418707 RepID=A0ABQ4S261_9HYPH|nr:septal ring lytic transglycosylase RlpA family protein [Methylobacterium iners]GJD96946.1 Endolytic peptidoglycan transglycosylase RlpA [Methylobacterium iners]
MAGSTKAARQLARTVPFWRLLAVSGLALATANCANNPQKYAAPSGSGSGIDPKYGVKASPRLYNEGDVIPKGGGRRFSGKPYVVAGRTYVPREDAKGYIREGLASWYGAAFHGRLTANGEVFDRNSIAAAHPTMPLPSYARVTNLANGHSMIVRVNDRGPYHADRLIDVSEEAAQALDFRRRGTARVRVEYVGKASTAGSDDRKLMATLRTDGQPAGIRGRAPVMMADLGPEAEPPVERLSRPARPALAFRPDPQDEAPPVPRPTRPASVVVAAAPTVAVPAALQPTRVAQTAFRPAPVAGREPPAPAPLAGVKPAPSGARPTMQLAAAGLAGKPAPTGLNLAGPRSGLVAIVAQKPAQPGPRPTLAPATRTAALPPAPSRSVAPLPATSKLAIAKLATAPVGKTPALPLAKAAPPRRSQIAEIY